MKCPTCRKDVEPGTRYAPFCSERCRTIDLGNWAAQKYRIPVREPRPETEDEHKDKEQS